MHVSAVIIYIYGAVAKVFCHRPHHSCRFEIFADTTCELLKMDATMTSPEIDFIVNHLILPPKLPQEDEDLEVKRNGELRILDLTTEAAKAFVEECGSDVQDGWISIFSALTNWNRVSSIDSFHKETFEDLLINLKPQGQKINQG